MLLTLLRLISIVVVMSTIVAIAQHITRLAIAEDFCIVTTVQREHNQNKDLLVILVSRVLVVRTISSLEGAAIVWIIRLSLMGTTTSATKRAVVVVVIIIIAIVVVVVVIVVIVVIVGIIIFVIVPLIVIAAAGSIRRRMRCKLSPLRHLLAIRCVFSFYSKRTNAALHPRTRTNLQSVVQAGLPNGPVLPAAECRGGPNQSKPVTESVISDWFGIAHTRICCPQPSALSGPLPWLLPMDRSHLFSHCTHTLLHTETTKGYIFRIFIIGVISQLVANIVLARHWVDIHHHRK